jgi:hypothetical protein
MAGITLLMLNCLIPGSGLVLRRRLILGLSLLLPALALVSIAIIGLIDRDRPTGQVQGAIALLAYLGCSVLGALAWWWCERVPRIDPARVHELYRAAAAAFLGDRLAEADQAARRLTRLLPHEAGSWRLLELVARARGSATQATAAGQRAKRLETPSS